MNCPVLDELRHTESYNPDCENPPILSEGDYDIAAIRSCGEDCRLAAHNLALAARVRELEAERDRLREALENYGDHDTRCARKRTQYERGICDPCLDIPCTCGFDTALQPPQGEGK